VGNGGSGASVPYCAEAGLAPTAMAAAVTAPIRYLARRHGTRSRGLLLRVMVFSPDTGAAAFAAPPGLWLMT
jgi:hypothetical protein